LLINNEKMKILVLAITVIVIFVLVVVAGKLFMKFVNKYTHTTGNPLIQKKEEKPKE